MRCDQEVCQNQFIKSCTDTKAIPKLRAMFGSKNFVEVDVKKEKMLIFTKIQKLVKVNQILPTN